MATTPQQGLVWDTSLKKWTTPQTASEVAGKTTAYGQQVAQGGSVPAPNMVSVPGSEPLKGSTLGINKNVPTVTPGIKQTPIDTTGLTGYQKEVAQAPDWVNQERLNDLQKYSVIGNPSATPPKVYRGLNDIYTDPNLTRYQKNAEVKKYYDTQGIKYNPSLFPTSEKEELDYLFQTQEAEKSYLEKQLDATKAKATSQFKGTAGAMESMFAQGREGPVSASNALIAAQGIKQMEADRQQQFAQMDETMRQLKMKQDEQLKNYTDERAQEIATIQANLAKQEAASLQSETERAKSAKDLLDSQMKKVDNLDLSTFSAQQIQNLADSTGLDVSYLQSKQTSDLTKGRKDIAATQKATMEMFSSMAEKGIQIPTDVLTSISDNSGMPLSSLLKFQEQVNEAAKLKGDEKQVALDKARQELDLAKRGVLTTEAKNYEYVMQTAADMKLAGTSDDKIQNMMNTMFKTLGLRKDQYQMHADSQGGAYIFDPASGKVVGQISGPSMFTEGGRITYYGEGGQAISAVPTKTPVDQMPDLVGTTGGQCGRFVNNQLGSKFGDSYESKVAKINSQEPVVGGAFIYPPTKNNPYGHVGIVKSINADGTITAIDSNWKMDEKVMEHNIPMSSITGYYVPKTAASVPVTVSGVPASDAATTMAMDYIRSGKLPEGIKAGSVDYGIVMNKVKELQNSGWAVNTLKDKVLLSLARMENYLVTTDNYSDIEDSVLKLNDPSITAKYNDLVNNGKYRAVDQEKAKLYGIDGSLNVGQFNEVVSLRTAKGFGNERFQSLGKAEYEGITAALLALKTAKDIKKLKEDYNIDTGPYEALSLDAAERTDMHPFTSDELFQKQIELKVKTGKTLATYMNKISGAAVNDKEVERLKSNLPTYEHNDTKFNATVDDLISTLEYEINTNAKRLGFEDADKLMWAADNFDDMYKIKKPYRLDEKNDTESITPQDWNKYGTLEPSVDDLIDNN